MSSSASIKATCLSVLICSLVAFVFASDKPPVFSVKFSDEGVAFSGSVNSEETGQELARAVNAVRPDLKILNEGLRIDPEVSAPELADIKSLIAEIGISTHEGGIAIWDDAILLSGLTDSRITLTALKIRLEPILGARTLINRLCIVPSDDLPDISVKLANGETAGPLLDFDYYPTAEEMFEAPGLALEKIFPAMAMLSDLGVLDGTRDLPTGTESSPETPGSPPRAVPLMTSTPDGGPPAISPAILRAVPTGPRNSYVHLEPVRFSRNSFLLQANQSTAVDGIVKHLNTPPLAGNTILVKPVKYGGGSGAFGDYLLEKRGTEVQRLLTERGIPAERISIRPDTSADSMDQGEVRIMVEIPAPVVPPSEPDEEKDTAGTPEGSEGGNQNTSIEETKEEPE